MRIPTIVAIGGGGFLQDNDWVPEGSMEDWLARVAMPKGDNKRPDNRVRVCYLGQAGGDSDVEALWFYRAFSTLPTPCYPSVLNLFNRKVVDIRDFLLSQDLIYVGGGNTASMLAIWRAHGVDKILRECWEAGVMLSGMSAGANCWFQCSTTDSFGPNLVPLNDGLGFLDGSCSPHYDGEEQRRPLYQSLVAYNGIRAGHAIDDHAAIVFKAGEKMAIASKEGKRACYVERSPDGVSETPLHTSYIGV